MTIVEYYRELANLVEEYEEGAVDIVKAKDELDKLNVKAKNANLKVSVDESVFSSITPLVEDDDSYADPVVEEEEDDSYVDSYSY